MATAPKQANGNTLNNNGSLGKRKKSRGSKGSYLSKWLDKTMHQVQESTPSMDTYNSFLGPNSNWPMGSSSQFAPGYDPYKHMYGCAPEPMSLPSLPSYYNPMVPLYGHEYRCTQNVNKSIQVQRPRLRRRCDNKAEEVFSNSQEPLASGNFSDTQDFASLPPIVTSVADTNSNSDVNINDKDDASNARRYSDPCVGGLPDVAKPANGDVDATSESSSDLSGSQVGSRLLTCLLDQIKALKITNERLNKELQETKGMLGGQYSPGFLTDLVREVRDATRMREEAMYSRVRAMMVERSDNVLASSEAKFMEKSLEEIKSSLRASEADKHRMMDRIAKLEEDLRAVRFTNSRFDSNENKITNGNVEDTEAECMRLRKEVAELRKAKQNAEDHALKLERLVTQLRSKFNGLQITNGPDSLPSDAEHETSGRARRTSLNSSNNSTVVFGPVTDL